MWTAIVNACRLVVGIPGYAWRKTENFMEKSVRKWWHSHYQ